MHVRTLSSGSIREYQALEGGLADMLWSPDAEELLVLATDIRSAEGDGSTGELDPDQLDPQVHRPAESWRRLFRLVVKTGEMSAIGPIGLTVWEFDWLGGDIVAAVTSADPSENGWYTAAVSVIDVPSGTARTVHAPTWQVSGPRLAPDEKRIAFLEGICSDRGGVSGVLTLADVTSGDCDDQPLLSGVRAVAPEVEVTGLAWRDDGRLWYAGRQGLRSTCGSVSLAGVPEELWSGDSVLREFSASRDGRWLAAVKETVTDPPEISVFEVDSPERGWQALTTINSALTGRHLPAVEPMRWTAPDGLDIEGLFVHPADPGGLEAPALVVLVHGGPTAAWGHAFPCVVRHAALLALAGYAVLLPNPRGSTGRGQAFAQAVVGDLGGAELQDALSGLDACVAAGRADAERVGIMGASHGGFMTAWAVTQTQRFRAGVAIACVSDYLSLHYTSDIGALDDILFVGKDRVAAYLERSPIVHVDKCATPMLIIHGERDTCCPPAQARELYGGLVENGIETELVIYPREGHGYVEYDHQVDLWHRVRGWFDTHLALRR
ncbi:MAG: S9 family peptidase [Actinomycetota bacterium]|nr:S9 family peptidase [Actinomycetota bacterium]